MHKTHKEALPLSVSPSPPASALAQLRRVRHPIKHTTCSTTLVHAQLLQCAVVLRSHENGAPPFTSFCSTHPTSHKTARIAVAAAAFMSGVRPGFCDGTPWIRPFR